MKYRFQPFAGNACLCFCNKETAQNFWFDGTEIELNKLGITTTGHYISLAWQTYPIDFELPESYIAFVIYPDGNRFGNDFVDYKALLKASGVDAKYLVLFRKAIQEKFPATIDRLDMALKRFCRQKKFCDYNDKQLPLVAEQEVYGLWGRTFPAKISICHYDLVFNTTPTPEDVIAAVIQRFWEDGKD